MLNKIQDHKLLALALVIILIVAGVGVYYFAFYKKPVTQSASQYTKGEPAQNSQAASSQQSGSTSSSQSGQTSSDKSGSGNSQSLVAPSGSFVSAHHVSLSTALSSVCNTTPSASCAIIFRNDSGATKQLPAKTADSGGTAIWNSWTPDSIGLSAGTWHVSAQATLGDQSQSSSDAMNMVISQ